MYIKKYIVDNIDSETITSHNDFKYENLWKKILEPYVFAYVIFCDVNIFKFYYYYY